MVRKLLVHELDDILRHCVGCKSGRLGQVFRTLLTKTATVFCIKVPFVTNRVFAFHQNTRFLAHFSVKKLKA